MYCYSQYCYYDHRHTIAVCKHDLLLKPETRMLVHVLTLNYLHSVYRKLR
jgi:hypothetical protein